MTKRRIKRRRRRRRRIKRKERDRVVVTDSTFITGLKRKFTAVKAPRLPARPSGKGATCAECKVERWEVTKEGRWNVDCSNMQ